MQNATVNVNGQIFGSRETPLGEAKISIFDRGYLYGDSVYEVIRTYNGQFFLLDEHLARLEKSAELCHMKLDQSLKAYRDEIERTFQTFRNQSQNKKSEVYARIIVSRGIGKIGFSLSCLTSPTQFTIIIQPIEPPTEDQFKKGFKLSVSSRLRNSPRALDPAMKSGNYLNCLLAYLEAAQEGYQDALLCNSEGYITEGTTFNIFYIRKGIIATPPLDIGILDGLTRRKVMQAAASLKYPVREVRFPKERLYEADEVFLTGSVKEVGSVTQVDSIKIGNGKPGPITLKLHQLFRQSTQGKMREGS